MCGANVLDSATEVDRLATETACLGQPKGCAPIRRKWERLPWAHSIQVSTGGGTIFMTCQRAYVLIGAWSCTPLMSLTPRLETAPKETAPSAAAASASPPMKKAPAPVAPRPTPSTAASP